MTSDHEGSSSAHLVQKLWKFRNVARDEGRQRSRRSGNQPSCRSSKTADEQLRP